MQATAATIAEGCCLFSLLLGRGLLLRGGHALHGNERSQFSRAAVAFAFTSDAPGEGGGGGGGEGGGDGGEVTAEGEGCLAHAGSLQVRSAKGQRAAKKGGKRAR